MCHKWCWIIHTESSLDIYLYADPLLLRLNYITVLKWWPPERSMVKVSFSFAIIKKSVVWCAGHLANILSSITITNCLNVFYRFLSELVNLLGVLQNDNSTCISFLVNSKSPTFISSHSFIKKIFCSSPRIELLCSLAFIKLGCI